MVKNASANAGDAGAVGSISGSGRSPGVGNATHSRILAWKTPWTEESGRLYIVHGVTKSQTGLGMDAHYMLHTRVLAERSKNYQVKIHSLNKHVLAYYVPDTALSIPY